MKKFSSEQNQEAKQKAFSQVKRKFRKCSENFAIIAKLLLFTAKFRYSEYFFLVIIKKNTFFLYFLYFLFFNFFRDKKNF